MLTYALLALAFLGVATAAWWLGRSYERRRNARLHKLVAPFVQAGVAAFNRADASSVLSHGARRTDHRFNLRSRG